MKSKFVAVAAVGLFATVAAHAQSSVTLYGSLDAGVGFVNNAEGKSLWAQTSGALSDNYFGLRGVEDLGGGLSAIFKLESGFNVGNGALGGFGSNLGGSTNGNLFARQAYVGLSSNAFGTLTLGRQFDTAFDYLSPLALSGQANGVMLAAHPGDADNLGGSFSTQNAVKFSSANFSGLSFGGMYGFSNSASSFKNGQMWSIGAGYDAGPLKAALAYVDRNGASVGANGDNSYDAARQRVLGAGANYTFGPASVGLVYTHTTLQNASSMPGGFAGTYGNHAQFDNYEINGTYSLTPAMALVGSYTYTHANQSADGTQTSPKAHTVVLGADYGLSKRTDFYLAGAYQHAYGNTYAGADAAGNPLGADVGTNIAGMIPSSSTPNQVVLGVGMRHRF